MGFTPHLSLELRENFNKIAIQAFQIIILLKLFSCAFYIVGYVVEQVYVKILLLNVLYVIPMVISLLYSFRKDGIKAVKIYLWYVAVVTIARTPVTEPFYIVDVLNIMTYIVMANFVFSKEYAARYFIFLVVLYIIGCLVTMHLNPFHILYKVHGWKVSAWTALGTSVLSIFFGQRAYLIQMGELIKEVEKSKNQLKDMNEDYRTIQRLIIHDFINDLLITQLTIENLLLAKNKTVDYFRDGLKKIEKRIMHVSGAIKNLRELYKGAGKKDTLFPRTTNALEIIKSTVYFFEPQLQEKNIHVKLPENNLESCNLMVDSTAFSFHIMNNLMSNAIKFSDENSEIKFDVDMYGNAVGLSIENLSSQYTKSFEKAFALDGVDSIEGTAGEKGLGIGLSIVKRMSEKLNVGVEAMVFQKDDMYTYRIHLNVPRAT